MGVEVRKFDTFCPEHRLLLLLLSPRKDDEAIGEIRTLCGQNLDWQYIVQKAELHSVAGLMAWVIGRLRLESIPSDFSARLQMHYRENVMRNMVLTREMRNMLHLFKAHAIDSIVYKGPLQASEIYGNLGLRHLCDLDLIVRRQDLKKTIDVLLGNGFSLCKPTTLGEIDRMLEDRSAYECSFVNRTSGAFVEIHWQVLRRHSEMGVDADYIWRHALPVTVGGIETFSFSNEIKFFLSCLHNEKHGWGEFKFLCDIAWMLASPDLVNVEAVMEEARRIDREKTVLKTILLANRLFGVPVSEAVGRRIEADNRLKMETALHHYQIFKNVFCIPSYSGWLNVLDDAAYLEPAGCGKRNGQGSMLNYFRAILAPQYEDHKKFPEPLPKSLEVLYVVSRVMRHLKYWMYNHHVNNRRIQL